MKETASKVPLVVREKLTIKGPEISANVIPPETTTSTHFKMFLILLENGSSAAGPVNGHVRA